MKVMIKNSGEAHEVARVEPGDGGFAAAVLDAVRAPVMVVDHTYHGKMTATGAEKLLRRLMREESE